MNEFDWKNYQPAAQQAARPTFVGDMAAVMRKVYAKMFGALIVTALTAFGVANSESMLSLIFGNSAIMIGLVIAELACVFVISGLINKLSNTTATILFYIYSVLNGMMLSSVLLIYTGASVALTFLVCAAMFGVMSIYGYTTDKDLSRFGSIMFMGLIGLLIMSLVNFFLHSSGMEWIISFLGVVIFVGLTAWDTQKIKEMSLMSAGTDMAGKVATIGALSLYLDFINLFLYLLRFFGRRD